MEPVSVMAGTVHELLPFPASLTAVRPFRPLASDGGVVLHDVAHVGPGHLHPRRLEEGFLGGEVGRRAGGALGGHGRGGLCIRGQAEGC